MSSPQRVLIVEARDLDTDDRITATFDVEMPSDEAGQRAQLVEIVAGLHPSARMRSFGNGAASFLDTRHLVVAHYVGSDPDPAERVSELHGASKQQSLFAA